MLANAIEKNHEADYEWRIMKINNREYCGISERKNLRRIIENIRRKSSLSRMFRGSFFISDFVAIF